MTQHITFEGRVAIITGAGRGLGRAYAQLLAARGAKIVVNDVGGSMSGRGYDDRAAAQTAAHAIAAAGGHAVSDTSDVATTAGAQDLVDHAIEAFGRLDIVVNNAGIYSMDDFPDLDAEALRRHFDIHVGGSFNVTRAAWPHLAASGVGRVVMTTSTGALGADNMIAYGQAKGAVLALGRALAQVGIRDGIKVNNLAPLAMTRMMRAGAGIEQDLPEDPAQSPALVAPMVAVLCHESCPSTGETYISGLRHLARLVISANSGYTHPDALLTPEQILENWADVSGFQQHSILTTSADQMAHLRRLLAADETRDGAAATTSST